MSKPSTKRVQSLALTPAYEDEAVRLYHGDAFALAPKFDVDVVITDPPYSNRTHKHARTNAGFDGKGDAPQLVDFDALTSHDLAELLASLRVRRWVVMTCDYVHAIDLERSPPSGLEFVRLGIWAKLSTGAPQISGDRPGMGWEAVAMLHRAKERCAERKRWNGGGRDSVFYHLAEHRRGTYPTQKPEGLAREFVTLFSDPGETILDPFAGSGTTLRAAKDLGRKAIGIDKSPDAIAIAERRMRQEVLPL